MSLIPFIMDLADELNEFNRSLVSGMDVDDFGFGMYPHELQQTSPRRPRTVSQLYLLPNIRGRHHPYWRGSGNSTKACCHKSATAAAAAAAATSTDKEATGINDKDNTVAVKPATAAYSVVNKNGFQVSMNVKQFSPNELTVKTIDNCIVVEGQHDEKEDGHGVISRHFVRKYMLPKGFDPNEVLSTLSSDGILTVKAPPPPAKADEQQLERVVHIQHTGPAQLSAKDGGGASNKEKTPQPTPAVTAITTTTQTPTSMQQQQMPQQQQQQQQQQEPEDEIQEKVVNERNGDANANEINSEQETATETASVEPMLVVSNVVNAAAMDGIVNATSAAATTTAANEENKNEPDTNIADIPMADVAVPAGVIESDVVMTPADNAAAALEDGTAVDGAANANDAVATAATAETVGETPAVDEIVLPTPPTAGDLVAAADAAIILAKTQCENGTKAATEELAN